MTIGVLALQGDFADHLSVLHELSVEACEVRTPTDLAACRGLILPGGESTVIAKLLTSSGLRSAIRERTHAGDLAVFGTCAGAILLASDVTGQDAPATLALMDMTVDRNAYGSQAQSFETYVSAEGIGSLRATFIRAPRLRPIGENVQVLAMHEGDAVLVRQERLLAATFHTEVHGEKGLHAYFIEQVL